MIPTVKRITKAGAESMDLLTYEFLEYRTIYLYGEITDSLAVEINAQLDYLDKRGKGDIRLYINSPGGSVTAGLSIADAMRHCKCDISTVCTGIAASMGAFLLSFGTKGKRFVTPLAEVVIHQPFGDAQGQASDIELAARHITRTKRKLNQMLADNTGKTMEDVARDCDRDYFMTAEEALEYGIVDSMLPKA